MKSKILFGHVDEQTKSYNYNDNGQRSRNTSMRQVPAVPKELITGFQPGEFVIMDKTGRKFKQKFRYKEKAITPLPVLTHVTEKMLTANFQAIKKEVASIGLN